VSLRFKEAAETVVKIVQGFGLNGTKYPSKTYPAILFSETILTHSP